MLWQLWDDGRVSALVRDVLPAAGHDLGQQGESGDPVERWRWLTRTWDPDAPVRPLPRHHPASWDYSVRRGREEDCATVTEPRWGGMSRGIGNGLPDPAIEVCTHSAAGVAQAAIIAQHGGHATFQRVLVTDGPFEGQRGYVRESGWAFDDTTQTADGPAGYVVDLDDTEGTQDIDAHQLRPSFDHRWPRRPRGVLKDGLPVGLRGPFPPRPSCAEDLETILARAFNPQDVPEELRQTIAAAFAHHHLDMGSGANPEPNRVSWRVTQHWYQLTEHYAEGRIAQLWEVEFKQHLHDPEPVVYLALSEPEAQAVIAQRTERV